MHLVEIAWFAGRAPAPAAQPLAAGLAQALAAYIARNGLKRPSVVVDALPF